MSDFATQQQHNRQPKGKRGETTDSAIMNTGQGPNNNSRPPSLPNNHHQGSQQPFYQNHRPHSQRGRGGHYNSQNAYGGHPANRRFSPTPSIPNGDGLSQYLESLWREFKKEYKDNTGNDIPEDTPQQPSTPQPPLSPRVTRNVNSPHRNQTQQHRYSHQNSTGSNWSVNSGGGNGGRRFSENGEHSNTGSLRRHHNNRGGGNFNSPASNQPWQRGGNFNNNNRQNSPNNTLNRQGSRNTPRPVPTSTPPVATNASSSVSSVSPPAAQQNQQQQEAALTGLMELSPGSSSQQTAQNASAPRSNKSSTGVPASNGGTVSLQQKSAGELKTFRRGGGVGNRRF